ncbi:helix-turn-helix domain-containing protein [Henriciella sp.]|uniref:helix-turn-helix domain-containing protein n=1 Tax=Henriciella sp. TaxID=1968823 RepID=UPI0026164A04|nr:helix-turn-helix domain-containing protein [Henriciella sp.]
MPSIFRSTIQLCGLSQRQAALYLDVSPSSVDKWCRGVRPVPDGVWSLLSDLWQRIEAAADFAADHIETNGLDPRALHNFAADDGLDPLPEGADDAAGALALMLVLGSD